MWYPPSNSLLKVSNYVGNTHVLFAGARAPRACFHVLSHRRRECLCYLWREILGKIQPDWQNSVRQSRRFRRDNKGQTSQGGNRGFHALGTAFVAVLIGTSTRKSDCFMYFRIHH